MTRLEEEAAKRRLEEREKWAGVATLFASGFAYAGWGWPGLFASFALGYAFRRPLPILTLRHRRVVYSLCVPVAVTVYLLGPVGIIPGLALGAVLASSD